MLMYIIYIFIYDFNTIDYWFDAEKGDFRRVFLA